MKCWRCGRNFSPEDQIEEKVVGTYRASPYNNNDSMKEKKEKTEILKKVLLEEEIILTKNVCPFCGKYHGASGCLWNCI